MSLDPKTVIEELSSLRMQLPPGEMPARLYALDETVSVLEEIGADLAAAIANPENNVDLEEGAALEIRDLLSEEAENSILRTAEVNGETLAFWVKESFLDRWDELGGDLGPTALATYAMQQEVIERIQSALDENAVDEMRVRKASYLAFANGDRSAEQPDAVIPHEVLAEIFRLNREGEDMERCATMLAASVVITGVLRDMQCELFNEVAGYLGHHQMRVEMPEQMPVEPGSLEDLAVTAQWLVLDAQGGWGGAGVGTNYVDARADATPDRFLWAHVIDSQIAEAINREVRSEDIPGMQTAVYLREAQDAFSSGERTLRFPDLPEDMIRGPKAVRRDSEARALEHRLAEMSPAALQFVQVLRNNAPGRLAALVVEMADNDPERLRRAGVDPALGGEGPQP